MSTTDKKKIKKVIPRIALRTAGKDKHLDDIVIKDVETVHFEDMGQGWWLGVYLQNGDRICFWIGEGKMKVRLYEKPTKKFQDYDEWLIKNYLPHSEIIE